MNEVLVVIAFVLAGVAFLLAAWIVYGDATGRWG